MTYRPKQPARLAVARRREGHRDRPASAFGRCSPGQDKVGHAAARHARRPRCVYAAAVAPDIAHSIDDVDRAMQWGFGWELGPFETVGRDRHQDGARCARSRPSVPPLVAEQLAAGRDRFRDGRVPAVGSGLQLLRVRAGSHAGSQEAIPAAASSISATACWRRAALEDERDRRRHRADASGRADGSRRELRGARHRHRRARTSRPAPT